MGVANEAGTIGNPTLQVGGEHEAVIVAAPGDKMDRLQVCVHDEPGAIAPGLEDVQVSGIFVSTMPPFVFGNELLPITSVTVATAVCEVAPLSIETLVCPEPAAPISRAIFWTGQVEKKSRTGEVAPEPFVSVGCRNVVLVAPLADA